MARNEAAPSAETAPEARLRRSRRGKKGVVDVPTLPPLPLTELTRARTVVTPPAPFAAQQEVRPLATPPPVAGPTAATVGIVAPDATATRRSARRTLTLIFSTGDSVAISGTGIVGRRPSRDQGYDIVVPINDDNGTISRDHFAFGATPAGQAWVVDLNSANGTWVDGRRIPTGTRAAVDAGMQIRFGSLTANVVIS